MCGICGIYAFDGTTPDRATIERMNATLRHRGPDEGGVRIDGRCALGARRLSILDLERGAQPLSNEEGTVWVAYNGEIYNAPDLREVLEARGHAFRTRADTEVLVHGYEAWGDGIVERLNGMFAFALYDAPRERLLLARDGLGIKPLVYAERDGKLLFASEIKALRAHPAFEGILHAQSVSDYLSFGYVPAPWTIFRGVWKLEPGRRLIVRPGGLRQEIHWAPRFLPRAPLGGAEEAFRETLRRAVRRHLASDVPLGVFLSGGLDSASIVASLSALGVAPIRTFTIGFEGDGGREMEIARLVAERFGTEHSELVLPPPPEERVEEILRHLDEPFADPSLVPTEALCRFGRKEVKVALAGDGGDELFGGYDWYTRQNLLRPLRCVPLLRPLRRWLGALEGFRRAGALGRLRRLLYDASLPFERSFLRTAITFRAEDKAWLLVPEVLGDLSDLDVSFFLARWFGRTEGRDRLERMLDADLRHYLPGSCLAKVDAASMMRSLEVRVPFLDREMVELGLSLPSRAKVRGLVTKWLVRRAMAGRLPAPVLRAPKRGFGMPVARWLREGLAGAARDRLLDPEGPLAGLVRRDRLRWMWEAHTAGRRDFGQHLWKLLVLAVWLDGSGVTSEIPRGDRAEVPPAVAITV